MRTKLELRIMKHSRYLQKLARITIRLDIASMPLTIAVEITSIFYAFTRVSELAITSIVNKIYSVLKPNISK